MPRPFLGMEPLRNNTPYPLFLSEQSAYRIWVSPCPDLPLAHAYQFGIR